MSYSTLQNSGDDLQRKREQIERKWHFIGRAYVCNEGGCEHQHLRRNDWHNCKEEDMKTKLKREHARYLKDQDLKIAGEKTKRTEIVQTEQTKREEIRANRERQRAEEHFNEMKIQHAHDIEMKRLEMEVQHAHDIEMKRLEIEVSANNMESSRVEELVNSFCDLLIRINQSTNHESTLYERSQISLLRQNLDEWM